MALEEREVRHVMKLARLEAGQGELSRLGRDLAAVLEYMECLSGLDVDGVQPMTHGDVEVMVLRDDEPAPSARWHEALESAPAEREGHFAVPRVLGGEETP